VGRAKGPYTPLLQRERQESVDVVNERYRRRKGIPEPDPEQEKDEDGDE
jgi:tRNA pseudouridine38/39 synthase